MPTHWTYEQYEPDVDLFQGDIIARTDSVIEVLGAVHRHFCDEKYLAFLIVTQTCDLVVRKRRCKAQHINLAVIRSLEDLLPNLFEDTSASGFSGIYREEAKEEAQKLLERILNQNEQVHGVFYLHPDADVGIAVPAVALLRVSIALRSKEHYAVLRESRCGRLATEYRNKIGWLAGNLYSRIDTPDWADQPGGAEKSKELISELLGGMNQPQLNVWAPNSWIQAATKNGIKISELPRDKVLEILQSHAPLPPSEVVMGRIRLQASKIQQEIGDNQLEALIDRLRDDFVSALIVADRILVIAHEVTSGGVASDATLLAELRDDAIIRGAISEAMVRAVASFRRHKGPRELSNLLAYFSQLSLLSSTACAHVVKIFAPIFGDDARVASDFSGRLRDEIPSVPLVDYVRSVGVQIINANLINKLIARMENDQAVKSALK